jgi:shikimate kinase
LSRPDLVLVGIPGSGKSTVAALLALTWGLPLVEVDDLVEAELGQPAEEVFASGEAGYRAVEERVSLAALTGPGVVALGSGAVDSAAVRAALTGLPVAWLRTSVAIATRRLGMNSLGMAALVAIRDRMDALLVERAPCYAAVASIVVDTDRLSAVEVAAAVSEQGAVR